MTASARSNGSETPGELRSRAIHELTRTEWRDGSVSARETEIASLVVRIEALEASIQELTDSVQTLRGTVRKAHSSRRHYRLFGR